uniref:Uncharacterized protein n=1 Tax=Schizaphis graminum TaxID=13262 RepID=A0A2S2NVD2_SCHGA
MIPLVVNQTKINLQIEEIAVIVPLLGQDVHLDMLSIVAVTVKKVVIVITEIEREKEREKENEIGVIVSENVEIEKEQFVKGTVNVIDVGKEKEKKNHHLEEENPEVLKENLDQAADILDLVQNLKEDQVENHVAGNALLKILVLFLPQKKITPQNQRLLKKVYLEPLHLLRKLKIRQNVNQ